MIQTSIFFTAKNGQKFEIRTPREDEAAASLNLMIEIADRCPYILSTSDDFRKKSIENQVKWIQDNAQSETAILLGVYQQNRLIGFCNGSSYSSGKRKHRAGLGVSLHPDFQGQGIGRKMMEVLIENMRRFKDIKIIELDVMMNNTAALKMYENLGFQRGGIYPEAFILASGETSDNLTMFMRA